MENFVFEKMAALLMLISLTVFPRPEPYAMHHHAMHARMLPYVPLLEVSPTSC